MEVFLLVLLFILHSRESQFCTGLHYDETNFVPYGHEEGDVNITLSRGEIYGPIQLLSPIVFYGDTLTSLYIYSDAIISPQNSTDSEKIPRISPLKANFTSTPVLYRVTQEDYTLQDAVSKIAMENSNFRDYHPNLAVVLTIHDAVYSNNTKNTTFQVVLVTDGTVSFAMLIYMESFLMGLETNYEIGFDAGDGTRRAMLSTNTPNGNGLHEVNIYRIDGHCITSASRACSLNSLAIDCDKELSSVSCACYSNSGSCDGDQGGSVVAVGVITAVVVLFVLILGTIVIVVVLIIFIKHHKRRPDYSDDYLTENISIYGLTEEVASYSE